REIIPLRRARAGALRAPTVPPPLHARTRARKFGLGWQPECADRHIRRLGTQLPSALGIVRRPNVARYLGCRIYPAVWDGSVPSWRNGLMGCPAGQTRGAVSTNQSQVVRRRSQSVWPKSAQVSTTTCPWVRNSVNVVERRLGQCFTPATQSSASHSP